LIGVALALALALAAWGCEALAFNVLVQRLPQEVPLIAPFAIVGLSAAIGALSMLPGGAGGVEAVMLLLLAKLGVDLPSATVLAATLPPPGDDNKFALNARWRSSSSSISE
jgi:uncharacterized membrane protein YbhN (UPF0104 family)